MQTSCKAILTTIDNGRLVFKTLTGGLHLSQISPERALKQTLRTIANRHIGSEYNTGWKLVRSDGQEIFPFYVMKSLSQLRREQDARQFKSGQFTILQALRFELQWLAQQEVSTAPARRPA